MTEETRRERTARLLAWRLDEVAEKLERTGAPTREAERMLELATIATDHAVELHLLSAETAESIWAAAADRHPVLKTPS